jgi:cell division septation protein DedD
VDSPRTHYQVSFTAKQALSLFVGLLAALALAYFFGLMTGLSGNEGPEAVATPAPTPPADQVASAVGTPGERLDFPPPVTAVPGASAPGAAAAPPSTVHVFEDGEGEGTRPARPTPRPAPAAAVASEPVPKAPAAGGFRVQVISVSSRSEAEEEAKRLSRRGFSARVEPGSGPRGTIYRVRVGPFATREEATRASERLGAEGRRDTWIVPPGQ